jgi:hypothetical protein
MCSKILGALDDNVIKDDAQNPGWLNFFALDSDRKYLRDVRPAEFAGDLPQIVKAMRYLGAEGPGKDDFIVFLLCSTDREYVSRCAESSLTMAAGSGHTPISFRMDDAVVENAALAAMLACDTTHLECHRHPIPCLPSRVIDVGSTDGAQKPKLHISQNEERAEYACLSYCWGRVQQYPTTRATLESNLQELRVESLSRTIRDAIKIARMLRFRYLWVDTLCIVQDDLADKEQHLKSMGLIFKNASLTIAAARAETAHDGFLNDWSPADEPVVLPFMLLGKDPIGTINVVRTGNHRTRDWPLDHRAWTFQEHLLSPRVLIFGTGGPMWQCQSRNLQSIIPSDKFFTTDLSRLPETLFRAEPLSCWAENTFTSAAAVLQWQHLLWKFLVQNYSARKISYASDRLPAIAGVVSELAHIWEDRCDFGIWNANLCQQLLWFVIDPRAERDLVPNVPSWAWIRVNTGVKHTDFIPTISRPSDVPLAMASRINAASLCSIDGGCYLKVKTTKFLPAYEMTQDRRDSLFYETASSVKLSFRWLDGWLDGKRHYYFFGPLAVFIDHQKEREHDWDWYNIAAYVTLATLTGSVTLQSLWSFNCHPLALKHRPSPLLPFFVVKTLIFM